VLEDARRLLGLRIQARILERSFSPKFLASIEIFKRAVSTSAKRHERFEELKNSPTFDTLTDVFPCWIMRPEDVCRIFPLREGIFDVVIFDEASQCNPDQALPGSTDCGLGGLACLGHAARRWLVCRWRTRTRIVRRSASMMHLRLAVHRRAVYEFGGASGGLRLSSKLDLLSG
jgi:hypothetical protein